MRATGLVAALLMLAPACADAEWQVRPFIGFTFGGTTTFFDPEFAVETHNLVIGISGGWLGEIFGLEADFSRAPGFFQTDPAPDPPLVLTSSATTLMGNVVIALPRRISGYGLRPYFVGGAGLVHLDRLDRFEVETVNRTLPAMTLGGGVTGFLTNRVGLNWDIRRVSTLRSEDDPIDQSLGDEQLSFWRATMAVAVRY